MNVGDYLQMNSINKCQTWKLHHKYVLFNSLNCSLQYEACVLDLQVTVGHWFEAYGNVAGVSI